MTNAQERVDRAQTAYDALVKDNVTFGETVTWLAGAIDRGREFATSSAPCSPATQLMTRR